MQKETILAKSRAENQSFDEREHQELRNSFGFGGVIICCICLLFSCVMKPFCRGISLAMAPLFLPILPGSLGIITKFQSRKKHWL